MGLIQRAIDYLWAYDAFISYGRADGRRYASGLLAALKQQGYDCFLDREDLPAGSPLTEAIRRGLERSSALIVVGSPAATESPYVEDEIVTFGRLHPDEPIIPVSIADTIDVLEDSSAFRKAVGDAVWLTEEREALKSHPSSDVVDELVKSFVSTKRTRRRMQWLVSAVVVLALALVGTLVALGGAFFYLNVAQTRERAALALEASDEDATQAALHLMEARDSHVWVDWAGGKVRELAEAAQRIPHRVRIESALSGRHRRNEPLPVEDVSINATGDRIVSVSPQVLWAWTHDAPEPSVVEMNVEARFWAVEFHPTDPDLFAAGGCAGRVALWRWAEGEEPRIVWELPRAAFRTTRPAPEDLCRPDEDVPATDLGYTVAFGVAFSPGGDVLAVAHGDGRISLWDVEQRRKLREISVVAPSACPSESGYGCIVRRVDFSSKGTCLAAAPYDGKARVFDLRGPTGDVKRWDDIEPTDSVRERASYVLPDAGRVNGVALGPECNRLVVAGRNRRVHVVDLRTEQPEAILEGHTTTVMDVEISPTNPDLFATAGWDSAIWLWSLRGDAPWAVRAGAHESSSPGLEFAPDGRALVTAGGDGRTLVWSTRAPFTLAEAHQVRAHAHRATAIAVHPEGRWLATADASGELRFWTHRGEDWQLAASVRLGAGIEDLAVSGSGGRIAAAARRGRGQGYDLRVFSVPSRGGPIQADPSRCTVAGDQARVAFRGEDALLLTNTAGIVECDSSKVRTLVERQHIDRKLIGGFGVDDIGANAFVAGYNYGDGHDQIAFLVDLSTGERTPLANAGDDHPWTARLSPHGTYAAIGTIHDRLRVWRVARPQDRILDAGHTETLVQIAFDWTEETIATATRNRRVSLWRIEPQEEIFAVRMDHDVTALAFEPKAGGRLVVGLETGEIVFFDPDVTRRLDQVAALVEEAGAD